MTNGYTSPPYKGKRGLIAALIVANVLMLVVGVISIPGNLRGAAEKREAAASHEPVSPAAEQEPAAVQEAINTPGESGEIQTTGAAVANLSTYERPDPENFLWYTEDVLYNGSPADANNIEDFSPLSGGWKALIIYDPNNEFDSHAMEFLNIVVNGTEDDLSLTLDWYRLIWSNEAESYDESGMEDTIFNGKWDSGGLRASGAGTIRLTQFYELNQKQYAVGTMDTPDGIPAFIALVRP